MATLAQFSKNIRRRGRQVENASTRIVKRVSIKALKILVTGTPVDTGQHRSNWRVGIGAPTRAVIAPYSPGKNLGINESGNANAAIAAGRARIESVRGKPGVGLTTAIYISNNAPAITKLNSGSSTQSPGGFVEMASAAARAEIANFRVFQDE